MKRVFAPTLVFLASVAAGSAAIVLGDSLWLQIIGGVACLTGAVGLGVCCSAADATGDCQRRIPVETSLISGEIPDHDENPGAGENPAAGEIDGSGDLESTAGKATEPNPADIADTANIEDITESENPPESGKID